MTTAQPKTRRARSWAFVLRWQVMVVLLPLLLTLGLAAWVVLGALDRTASSDVMNLWVSLPARCAYAAAALALTMIAVRRWRRKLSEQEQHDWWAGLMAGDRGAMLVYGLDWAFTLSCVYLLLQFFSLRSA